MKQKYFLQLIGKLLFRFSLYLGVTFFALFAIVGNPNTIKQAFIQTDAYERFVPAIIEENARLHGSGGSLSLKDPEAIQIISDSFPPISLQFNTEIVINGVYNWLNGVTNEPVFVVDLTNNINTMATNLSELGMSRLEQQPVCDVQPLLIDPFNDTCRPELYDFNEGRLSLASDIRNNNGIVSKMRYTADDLPRNDEGITIAQQFSYAPQVFTIGRYAHWILLGLMLQGVLLLVYATRKKRQAFRYIGKDLISSGIFISLTPLFYVYVLPRLLNGLPSQTGLAGSAVVLEDVLNHLTSTFNKTLITIGILVSLIGLSILALEKAVRPLSKYVKTDKKSGMASSEPSRKKRRARPVFVASTIPVQSSEGPRNTGKYQKDKKYRKIPKREI